MSDTPRTYPDRIEIRPRVEPLHTWIRLPGSKSITNRAMVLAALAQPGPTRLTGVLQSDDTEVMAAALADLGVKIRADWANKTIVVTPSSAGPVPAHKADLFVGNSGTTIRFLTAFAALGEGYYRLDGVARMRERPISDLLDALKQLGADVGTELANGFPPVIVAARGLGGGHVRIRGDVSSQFLSALLMVAPFARGPVTIEVDRALVSVPYVTMTTAMMRQFGVKVESSRNRVFHVPQAPFYQSREYAVEPDASAASYFAAVAAITGGFVGLPGFSDVCLQGDTRFANALHEMGCRVGRGHDGLSVTGGPLRGIDVDMNAISDTVMTLAAVACFAEGPTTIRNVAHIRHKETDRLAALATELRRVGADVDEFEDGLTITPGELHGAEIETYDDHRMAMSMALIGLRVPGIVIKNPACVSKTYPGFWDDFETLYEG